ncbi:M20/M25/M40 family metallo-hydrolase [Sphingomonas hengshuiensis]|uniref:M20/M25/M40 family metallo-hydrolase n=1 Tax=Sphingomonas hengshuiensis TaxID=1609977 RepID=UPI000697F0C3|nr:M20/M25/M40 family metallo-hydrolase [Sphingomonas hengshuiensis]
MRLPVLAAAAMLALFPLSAAQAQAPDTPQTSAERIRADVTYLADDALEGRFAVSKGYLTAAAYVAETFQKLGLQSGGVEYPWFQLVPVSIPVGKASRTFRVPNVIGILPGSDPVLKDEYVVLSAHLDHIGMDNKPGDKVFNGAMDNAAGVATMLEAARTFVASGTRPKRSILFVALTAEELGLVGSEYLAKHPVVGKGRVVADVNLDMPILLYDFQDVVAFGAERSTLGPMVERAAASMGVALSPDPMPQEQLFVRSDHYSFVKAGVPSVFLVTGFKNGGEKAFRGFLKTHYHSVSDQIDLPFDWNAGAKFAQINYLIAREIADAAEAPRWYEGDTYGDRYAKNAAKAPKPAR